MAKIKFKDGLTYAGATLSLCNKNVTIKRALVYTSSITTVATSQRILLIYGLPLLIYVRFFTCTFVVTRT